MSSPTPTIPYLIAQLAGVRIALPVLNVKEILRSVALARLPGAPPIMEGVLNLRGTLVPVLDLRYRLGLNARPNQPDDSIVVLLAGSRTVAVRVESADDVEDIPPEAIEPPASVSPVLARAPALAGVATRSDGALVIYDPLAFISQAEGEALDAALAAAP